ncbi:MAG: YrhK family protein [Jatrophihabitans sp.]
MKLLDPRLSDLTPAHISVAWRYQVVRTIVDFGAAVCFVVGSAFFFFVSTITAADWLFLVGSILFAFKPTIDVMRSAHLNRLPGQSDGPSHHSPARAGGDS